MPNYRRAFVPGGCWFFTVNLLDRRRRLLTEHIDALRAATRLTQTRHPFTIDAMVVLPDHIHAVWTLPPDDTGFSLRWRLIKIAFAQAVPKTEQRSAVRVARGERAIWQRRFWEQPRREGGIVSGGLGGRRLGSGQLRRACLRGSGAMRFAYCALRADSALDAF